MARLSAGVSALLTFLVLSLVDLAHRFGLPLNLPPIVLSLLGAGVVYTGLYWLLDNHLWRMLPASIYLKVPDLAGEWDCQGETLADDGTVKRRWSVKVTIVQTFDRLRVRLKTPQSGSNSIAAALIDDKVDGFRLMYNYQNDPLIAEPELKSHRGFCDLIFARDPKSADGEYFNGHGRVTYGKMKLTRL